MTSFQSGSDFKSMFTEQTDKHGGSFYHKVNLFQSPIPALAGSPFAPSPDEPGPRSPDIRSPLDRQQMVQTPSPLSEDPKESNLIFDKRSKVRRAEVRSHQDEFIQDHTTALQDRVTSLEPPKMGFGWFSELRVQM